MSAAPQLEMDFSAPTKSFRLGKMDFTIGSIYRFGIKRGLERSCLAGLLSERAKMKPEAAERLVGHWLTSEPYRTRQRCP